MTKEEKAKAYDEAYNVAESIHRFSSNPAEIKRMEEIFPQLREREDERIRKELKQYLEECTNLPNGHYCRDDFFAWLEKQKVTTPNKDIEKMRNAAINACKYMVDNFENSTKQYEDAIVWLENQSKQNPAEPNPAWNEEDKNMLKWVTGYLNNKMLNTSISEERTACKNAIAWFEKQGEHANFLSRIQVGDKVTRNEDGVLVNLSQLKRVAKKDENQGEQKKSYDTRDSSMMDNKKSPYGEKRDFGYFEEKSADKVEPKFKVGDVMRTLQEAADGIKDGLPVVVSIDDTSYSCTNEIIDIKDQDNYEYPPMNRRQKLAEWSEEDDYNLQCCIAKVQYDIDNGRIGMNRELLTWLNSLKNRVGYEVNYTTTKEWSEDDENRFRNLIYLVEHSNEGKATKEGFIKFINRLKNFK